MMLPYLNLISIDKTLKTPVFLQIAQGIMEQIRQGVMRPGVQLPGSRALAEALGVHRKTVVAAYEELLAQGWLVTQSSSGTFVSDKIPEIKPAAWQKTAPVIAKSEKAGFEFNDPEILWRPVIKGNQLLAFNDGFPDVRLAPWDALNAAFRTVVRNGHRKQLFHYADLYGETTLRETMADYLRETRGLAITEQNMLIGRGSTMGIFLTANVVLQPGDRVVVGAISYGSANIIFQQRGAQLLTVPVDHQGLDVDALEEICKHNPVKLVYVTPHHHYPTTVTMPAERRLRLLQLAATYHFCILEDDYDYDFHYDFSPVRPLAAVDNGGYTIYVGSLCKAIAPALRIGYVAGPADVIGAMGRFRRIIDRQGDNFLEAAIALLFKEGEIKRHLRKAQRAYHLRRDLFCEMLNTRLGNAVSFTKPTGGMAVWAQFDPSIPVTILAEKVMKNGLYIPNGASYAPEMNCTRMGFAATNEVEMEKGITILKNAI